MKTNVVIVTFCLLMAFDCQAQNFEGTIHYKSMASGYGVDTLTCFFGDSVSKVVNISSTGKVREKSYLNGILVQDFLFGLKHVYSITSFNKTAQILNPARFGKNVSVPKTEITQLKGVDTILGYPCQKFQMIVTEKKLGNNSETSDTIYVWSTLLLPVNKDVRFRYFSGAYRLFPGIMLRNESRIEKLTIVIEAAFIGNKINDETVFDIPKSYIVKQYNPKDILSY